MTFLKFFGIFILFLLIVNYIKIVEGAPGKDKKKEEKKSTNDKSNIIYFGEFPTHIPEEASSSILSKAKKGQEKTDKKKQNVGESTSSFHPNVQMLFDSQKNDENKANHNPGQLYGVPINYLPYYNPEAGEVYGAPINHPLYNPYHPGLSPIMHDSTVMTAVPLDKPQTGEPDHHQTGRNDGGIGKKTTD
ncbi:hypothetical protein ACQ4LE_006194 [Meloidogyne hapla]|uniref:Uncharacterized protein n=1 Tax=Meloidogyne hapla TaxID=6305 RepID=A0A1I8AZD1_MELHA